MTIFASLYLTICLIMFLIVCTIIVSLTDAWDETWRAFIAVAMIMLALAALYQGVQQGFIP